MEYYRNKVLNIDTRNRSILLRSINNKWSSDLFGIGSAAKIFEHAITDRRSVCIIPDTNRSRSIEDERMRLQNLYRNITQIRRETGRQEVYLGFPFLTGHVTGTTGTGLAISIKEPYYNGNKGKQEDEKPIGLEKFGSEHIE